MFPWAWQLELFMRIVHVVIIFRDCPLEGIVPTGRFSLLQYIGYRWEQIVTIRAEGLVSLLFFEANIYK